MEVAEILERAQPEPPSAREGGANGLSPVLIALAAFAVGVFLARLVDWRSHAHPRD